MRNWGSEGLHYLSGATWLTENRAWYSGQVSQMWLQCYFPQYCYQFHNSLAWATWYWCDMKASEDKSDHSRRKSCDQLAMSSKNEEKGGKVIYTILSPSLLYLATYWLICCFICITKMSFFLFHLHLVPALNFTLETPKGSGWLLSGVPFRQFL